MPTLSRKRRAPARADSDEESDATPVPPPNPRSRNANRPAPATHSEDDVSENEEGEESARTTGNNNDNDHDYDTSLTHEAYGGTATTRQQMVKNLVRLALASEYSRTPIRRTDISAKVLGREGRQFRAVFDDAQIALRDTFGMELVELPAKERVTLKERRAAQQATQSGATSSSAAAGGASQLGGSTNAWVLKSVLPNKYRTPEILPPPKVPTADAEASYVGLYSFVVAVITLNGGTLPEAKLERYLRRTNAEVNTPVDKTEKLLQRMIKEGYLVRVKENVGGDEVVEYMVGTRGKIEIGDKGVENLVRNVYGVEQGTDEQLEKRIERSLRVGAARTQATIARAVEQSDGAGSGGGGRGRGRPNRNTARTGGMDGADDDEEFQEG